MAPRAPESFKQFAARLATELANGSEEIRFGLHHFNQAVCVEAGVYRVRQLEVGDDEAKAFLAANGYFMPENAEEISVARTLVFEAATMEALLQELEKRWQGPLGRLDP